MLSILRDGLSKTFENSIKFPQESFTDSEEIKERKRNFSYEVDFFVRRVYKIISQLPFRKEYIPEVQEEAA